MKQGDQHQFNHLQTAAINNFTSYLEKDAKGYVLYKSLAELESKSYIPEHPKKITQEVEAEEAFTYTTYRDVVLRIQNLFLQRADINLYELHDQYDRNPKNFLLGTLEMR